MQRLVIVSAILAVVGITVVLAGVQRDGRVPGTNLADPVGSVGSPSLPSPPITPPTTTFEATEPQLVGFTGATFAGNTGVLSMSEACRDDFPGSRMCTVEEIMHTVNIPQRPGDGFAWVQFTRATTMAENCAGWTTDAVDQFGWTIELGLCYGGFVSRSCNETYSVACCATLPRAQ